ncbi:TetR/AcrR family transcriptional regulator [Nannocystis bainbridge]|uniref:TetR/AcrR family transcriptional regulator n=1 Tax=Nannocystis bainbridge TaxID=2995303 RepID=A0ABT5E6Y3_9BACT|nr:TetR/AcrR family transcriptional regulator [Nannocystis bainbridge]MDC0720572.1 TetR/AcrR family transcriptional regulator [Nannocystis bainbridge]
MVQARRKGKSEPLVRGEAVVRGVLAATLREAARAGYHGLRIEDVAALAGVNKTTVYRRWPTKQELVRDALLSIAGAALTVADAGSLREDLLAIARRIASLGAQAEYQGLYRLFVVEGGDPELVAIVRSLRTSFEAVPRAILEAADRRGELAPGVDPKLLFDVLGAALNRRLFFEREPLDEAWLQQLVDLLLHGALARPRTSR